MTDFMERRGQLHSIRWVGVDPHRKLTAQQAWELTGSLPRALTDLKPKDPVQACAYTLVGEEDDIDFIHRHFTGRGKDYHGVRHSWEGHCALDLVRHTFGHRGDHTITPVQIMNDISDLSRALTSRIYPLKAIPYIQPAGDQRFEVGVKFDFDGRFRIPVDQRAQIAKAVDFPLAQKQFALADAVEARGLGKTFPAYFDAGSGLPISPIVTGQIQPAFSRADSCLIHDQLLKAHAEDEQRVGGKRAGLRMEEPVHGKMEAERRANALAGVAAEVLGLEQGSLRFGLQPPARTR